MIGLACDLKIGLLRISVNNSFSDPNGIASELPFSPPGPTPALKGSSAKVRFLPFMHPRPFIAREEETKEETNPAFRLNEIRPLHMSMLECRVKDANVWVESGKIKGARITAS